MVRTNERRQHYGVALLLWIFDTKNAHVSFCYLQSIVLQLLVLHVDLHVDLVGTTDLPTYLVTVWQYYYMYQY